MACGTDNLPHDSVWSQRWSGERADWPGGATHIEQTTLGLDPATLVETGSCGQSVMVAYCCSRERVERPKEGFWRGTGRESAVSSKAASFPLA